MKKPSLVSPTNEYLDRQAGIVRYYWKSPKC